MTSVVHHFKNVKFYLPPDDKWTLVLLSDDNICAGRYINGAWDLGDNKAKCVVVGWETHEERRRVLETIMDNEEQKP